MFSYLNIALHASAHLVPLVHTSANYRFYFHLRLSIIPDKFTQNVGCVVSSSCLPSFLHNFLVVDECSFVKRKKRHCRLLPALSFSRKGHGYTHGPFQRFSDASENARPLHLAIEGRGAQNQSRRDPNSRKVKDFIWPRGSKRTNSKPEIMNTRPRTLTNRRLRT